MDQDFDDIRARALALVRGRADADDPDAATRKVAAPNEEREQIKQKLRGDVQAFLDKHPHARNLYARMRKKAGLTTQA